MRIIVNGENCDVADGLTVRALLESLGLEPERVAIELEGSIVRKPEWSSKALRPGDRVEIVHFVGGGSGRRARRCGAAGWF